MQPGIIHSACLAQDSRRTTIHYDYRCFMSHYTSDGLREGRRSISERRCRPRLFLDVLLIAMCGFFFTDYTCRVLFIYFSAFQVGETNYKIAAINPHTTKWNVWRDCCLTWSYRREVTWYTAASQQYFDRRHRRPYERPYEVKLFNLFLEPRREGLEESLRIYFA